MTVENMVSFDPKEVEDVILEAEAKKVRVEKWKADYPKEYQAWRDKHPQNQNYSEPDRGEEVPKDMYPEMGVPELLSILGQTVKKDDENKLLVFLCLLLTYTEDSQINIASNGLSSSGKSYLSLQIARLFPEEDVMTTGYASPSAFFHDYATRDEESNDF